MTVGPARPPVLIFDFDGLLVDTESTALRAWREEFAVYRVEFPTELWHSFLGSQGGQAAMVEAIRAGGVPIEAAELQARWRQRHLAIVSDEGLRDGVLAFLDEAKQDGARLAVASSATRDWVEQHLARVGIRSRFEVVCSREDGQPKPAPDIYLAVLAALGVTARDAVAFEDSPHGVTAAKAAGIFCVAVPNAVTASMAFDHADVRVESLAELSVAGLGEQLRSAAGYAPRDVHAPAP
jgi:HAD superfamily hydrolase (TIGR01509 family)